MKRIQNTIAIIVLLVTVTVSGVFSTGVFAGMQGFEGEYAISDPNKIIEIIVQFVTPPSVALKLAYERGDPMPPDFEEGMSFEEYALTGHTKFRQQLNQIMSSEEYGIFDEMNSIFNGLYMRVRGGKVALIAELPEVLNVFPSETYNVDLNPPPTPIVSGTPTANSITLTTITGAEYRMTNPSIGEWQTLPIFTGLTADTAYTFQARVKAANGNPASDPSSASAVIRTAFGVPNTGVPSITGVITAMLVFLAISVASCGYILRRRLINSKNG